MSEIDIMIELVERAKKLGKHNIEQELLEKLEKTLEDKARRI